MNITIEENFKEFERVFSEILKYASYKNVKIMIENCPMPGWNKDGFAGTISYSPELWDKMFEIFPELGLNFDPSHLLWLNINYLYALEKYKDKIFHIHAKDVIVNREGIEKYYGIYGKQINKKMNGIQAYSHIRCQVKAKLIGTHF
ncbi:sugar phosphate isomerase/epimerase family protein [Caloramator sp. Dgby_cultured_2]|uniref:sugar phosphate isomerase/epimerase family protein n=1 Tax=Caloramator sp. Dgby_cultured_2 TaxID=3029174 RepID=UPI00237E9E40|nr:TIM barrel protein [Caloramator sp. Dgby_cultured_2]WDU82369.1 TIM barrel protein [Caloramator sp. Dgby_cultured_2]